jgi:hypothetical protein
MQGEERGHIDVEFVFDRFLGVDDTLVAVHEVLRNCAPTWYGGGLKVRTDDGAKEIGPTDNLKEVVLEVAVERGPLYRRLVAEHGAGDERLFGTAELTGSSAALVVVVAVDQNPFAQIGGALLMGNRITLQVRHPKMDGQASSEWAARAFTELCREASPVWGALRSTAEYEAKVMSNEPGVVAAVGRDFGRFLPGLFASNFFGAPYWHLMGRDRLMSAPGREVQALGDGVQVTIGFEPGEWCTPEYKTTEKELLRHIGEEYFFMRTPTGERKTRAPNWS